MTPFDLDAARKDLAACEAGARTGMDVPDVEEWAAVLYDHLAGALARIEKLEEALTRAEKLLNRARWNLADHGLQDLANEITAECVVFRAALAAEKETT